MTKTIYLIGNDGGAIKTNDRRAVELLKRHGHRKCTRDEYMRRTRDLQRDERRELSKKQK